MLRDDRGGGEGRWQAARNVLGEALEICSIKPMTGFYRDGCCDTGREDLGSHTVCAVMTSAFLEFSKSRGNDLSTPQPEFGFPGLKPGDRWCLCAPRWQEAFEANQASPRRLACCSRGRFSPLFARRSQTLRRGPGVTLDDFLPLMVSGVALGRRWAHEIALSDLHPTLANDDCRTARSAGNASRFAEKRAHTGNPATSGTSLATKSLQAGPLLNI
jgi:uncharacterized protein (DUF2237 family)